MEFDRTRFAASARVYGESNMGLLAKAHICVVGLGGVGSWSAEALVRSGVGQITLIDGDDVCVSNSNRQLHALEGNFGRPKVDAVGQRLLAINPNLVLSTQQNFVTQANLATLITNDFSAVLDSCDAFAVKVAMLVHCRRLKTDIVTVGAAGGRIDPTRIRVSDLANTKQDRLLSLIRTKLRADFGYTRNPSKTFGIPAIYSDENVIYPQTNGEVCKVRPIEWGSDGKRLDCNEGLGAVAAVTGTFGLIAAAKVIERVLDRETRLLKRLQSPSKI